MDFRNNPSNDRNRFLAYLEQYINDYYSSNQPHKEPIKIIVPEIELSPDSLNLYTSYSGFLTANRRKILDDFTKILLPCGMVVQLEIDFEARICISYVI